MKIFFKNQNLNNNKDNKPSNEIIINNIVKIIKIKNFIFLTYFIMTIIYLQLFPIKTLIKFVNLEFT